MKNQEFKRSTVVIETPVFILHQFNIEPGIPIFVVPPHAGRHGNIAQNLIDKCVKAGRQTYAVELLSATQETKNTSISDLVAMLKTCQEYIGPVIDLVGLCQGGWLSAIFAAKYHGVVRKLALHASPINTQTGEDNCIEKYMKILFIIEYQKVVVAINGGIQPGYLQWFAFAMVNPKAVYIDRWTEMQRLIWDSDENGLEKWKKNNAWHDTPQDLAGVWFLDCLEHHFGLNDLYNGKWIVNNELVDLSRITCPVWLYAGEDDEITHQKQLFDLGNKVSGPVIKILFQGARHTKIFTGRKELEVFKSTFIGEV